MRRGVQVRKPAALPAGTPVNRQEWEAAMVRNAIYFTCSVPRSGPRPRGTRLEWQVDEYDTLWGAYTAAKQHVRSLVYAVAKGGDSAPLSIKDCENYLEGQKQ